MCTSFLIQASIAFVTLVACSSTSSNLLSLVSKVPPVLQVGLGDHIRCAVLHIPKPGAANANDSAEPLNEATRRLVDVIQPKLPESYRIAGAHHCWFEGRRVIHVAVRANSGPLSLVIVGRKPGESFEDMPKDPFVRASVDPYELAAFSTRNHLVFLVSQEGRAQNSAFLASIRPGVESFLDDLERRGSAESR